MNIEKLRKISYDEVSKCNRCGFCLPHCPIYKIKGVESASPRGRNAIVKAVIEGRLHLSSDMEKSIFSCVGCGACKIACFPSIDTKQLVFNQRAVLKSNGIAPMGAKKILENLMEEHNILGEPNEERIEWKDTLKDQLSEAVFKEKAETVYFVGCVSSFYPRVQNIPLTFSKILLYAEVDFTILGGNEWCCGYPLLGSGDPESIKDIIEHNMDRIRKTGAKRVVFTCPSCYSIWKAIYPDEFQLLSASELIFLLIKDGKLKTGNMDLRVTYHDPCDLGRGLGIYEEPREVLKSVKGLDLVEMKNSHQLSICCGGGGNIEAIDPELSSKVTSLKFQDIKETDAQMIITACQQCIRTMDRYIKKNRLSIVVKDITELVALSMNIH